jgi:hypothetical protein
LPNGHRVDVAQGINVQREIDSEYLFGEYEQIILIFKLQKYYDVPATTMKSIKMGAMTFCQLGTGYTQHKESIGGMTVGELVLNFNVTLPSPMISGPLKQTGVRGRGPGGGVGQLTAGCDLS